MKKNSNYSVLLPTLNEAGHIEKLINEIVKVFKNNRKKYEVIVVDDQSDDGTIKIVKKIKKKNNNVKIHVRKFGPKNLVMSLKKGIQLSKYDHVIWMDADFSHPPKYLSNFIKITNSNKHYDILVFSRFIKKSKRYFQVDKSNSVMIDKLSYFLNKICKFFIFNNFHDYTSGYICIKKSKLKKLKIKGYYGDYFINLIVDALIRNFNIKELPYIEKERASGISKTIGNKIDFFIKCYFYFLSLLRGIFKKSFSSFFHISKK